MARRPLIVIEGSQQAATPVVALLETGGWAISKGFRLPMADWLVGGVVCVGAVTSATDAALAVLAAVRGAGLVVSVSAREEVIELLVDDLWRIGPVDYWPGNESGPLRSLTVEQWCLLELLARGRTLTEAAGILHLSRRTADRKLAAARVSLGAKSTAEAVLVMESTLGEARPWLTANRVGLDSRARSW